MALTRLKKKLDLNTSKQNAIQANGTVAQPAQKG